MSIKFLKLGYRYCSKCESMVLKEYLVEGVCNSCSTKKCFFCGSRRNLKFVKANEFGMTWVCRWCMRKEYEVELNE